MVRGEESERGVSDMRVVVRESKKLFILDSRKIPCPRQHPRFLCLILFSFLGSKVYECPTVTRKSSVTRQNNRST